jgi:hypothetical protein
MGWGGIKNLPPGFDVFDGKGGTKNIVDEAIRGNIAGLSPGRLPLFADLKRNLLHQDFARYFDSVLQCAAVLLDVEGGKYTPEVVRDIVEPALATAGDQFRSIQADAERANAAHRKIEYDPLPSLGELYRRSRPIAVAYPNAAGAKEFDARYHAVEEAVRNLLRA